MNDTYPLAPELRPIREVLAKLDPKPKPDHLPPRKPYETEPSAAEKEPATALSGAGLPAFG